MENRGTRRDRRRGIERGRERENGAHTSARVTLFRCLHAFRSPLILFPRGWRGSSVLVPIALGIVYKTSVSCRAFQSSDRTFVPFFPFIHRAGVFLWRFPFSPSPTLSRCTNSMPGNKGDCMYYLACLPHACPGSSQSTFESRHDRYKAVRSQCNAIKSNPPRVLSRTRNPYYAHVHCIHGCPVYTYTLDICMYQAFQSCITGVRCSVGTLSKEPHVLRTTLWINSFLYARSCFRILGLLRCRWCQRGYRTGNNRLIVLKVVESCVSQRYRYR